jgi:CheY-like chemotaxis protein
MIVYIEDNATNADVLKRTLAQLGYECTTFITAADAVMYLSQYVPALILTDLHMPRTDGYELFRMLRAMPSLDQVPIVALTANVSADTLRRCNELGFNGVYSKPIMRKDLQDLLNKYIPK